MTDAVSGRTVWMWEARARPGGVDALAAWARQWAASEPAGEVAVYLSRPQDRVAMLYPAALTAPAPPPELLARPAQAWPFELLTP